MDANSLLEMMDKWFAHSRPSLTQILSRAIGKSSSSVPKKKTPVTLKQTKTTKDPDQTKLYFKKIVV